MMPTITYFTPKDFEKLLQKESLQTYYFQTVAGTLQLYYCSFGLYAAHFITVLEPQTKFITTPDVHNIVLIGTQFQAKVWQGLLALQQGTITSYNDLAVSLGYPKAYRAVANALGKNRIIYFIPCHRVLRKDGSLGGFSAGLEYKKALLAAEGIKK